MTLQGANQGNGGVGEEPEEEEEVHLEIYFCSFFKAIKKNQPWQRSEGMW